jgi:hypothetical protein
VRRKRVKPEVYLRTKSTFYKKRSYEGSKGRHVSSFFSHAFHQRANKTAAGLNCPNRILDISKKDKSIKCEYIPIATNLQRPHDIVIFVSGNP